VFEATVGVLSVSLLLVFDHLTCKFLLAIYTVEDNKLREIYFHVKHLAISFSCAPPLWRCIAEMKKSHFVFRITKCSVNARGYLRGSMSATRLRITELQVLRHEKSPYAPFHMHDTKVAN